MAQPQLPPKTNQDGLLFYLSLLTCFFLLLEISFFIQCNKAYLGDFTFVSNQIHIPWRVLPGIGFFIFAQLLVHFLFLMLLWWMASFAASVFKLTENHRVLFALFTYAVAIVFVLAANQILYPNSRVIELTSMMILNRNVAAVTLNISAALLIAMMMLALWGTVRHLGFLKSGLVGLLLLLVSGSSAYLLRPHYHRQALMTQPNIILVGVDSLRPDYLGHFGGDSATPFMDGFMNHATVFTDAVTPLARTFPSWTGILTSLYPRHVNVRTNLSDQTVAKLSNALPAVLTRAGYDTLFATDETRFSNLSPAYGFHQLTTPPIGLNDFLLGTFNDFPLSNLVVNTVIGKWLFPYSYGNRPAYVTYDPNSFLNLVQPMIGENHPRPVFLAAHFCLPHSPYLWRGLSGYRVLGRERYSVSVQRVDAQLKGFFHQLKKAGLLQNAVVVLLSDHGEALEIPGDRATERKLYQPVSVVKIPRFYPPSMSAEGLNESAGHGTDVLGLTQYHTVLAVRVYGERKQASRDVSGNISTLDIMPTVLDLAHVKKPALDGVSLASVVLGQAKQVPSLPIYLESDYSPQAIRTVFPETRKVFLEGIHLFHIDDKTLRLTVKPDMVDKIVHSKQIAVIEKGWILALYPQKNLTRMPILINLNSGEWTNQMNTPLAKQAPVGLMMSNLKQFYGDEFTLK